MFRKRARNSDDESDDCMPISKRINRLQIGPENAVNLQGQEALLQNGNLEQKEVLSWQHINNNNCIPGQPQQGTVMEPVPSTSNGNPSYEMFNGNSNQGNVNCDTVCEKYEPELDKSDNPHYYQANEVLFHAHTSRLKRQRTGMNRSFPNS